MRRIPWRRKWQPNPVFLPGESHAQRSLGVYSPWGCKVLNTTDPHTHTHTHTHTDTHLPLCSLSLWPALTSPPPAPPPSIPVGASAVQPCLRTGRPPGRPGQLPSVLNNGELRTLAATRETPPAGTRPLATSSAAPPWPRVGARNFPGGETTIRREQEGTGLVPGLG